MNDNHSSRWHETRAMLADLLAWFDETQQWAEETSQAAQLVESAGAEEPEPPSDGASDPEMAAAHPDLFALLAAMTALRQEVKLQTRSARHDREQVAQTLEQVSGLAADFERARQEDAARLEETAPEVDSVPMDTLVELHDALSRAERQASQLVASTATTLRGWGVQPDEPAPSGQPEDDAASVATRPGVFDRLRQRFGRPADAQPAAVAPPQAADATDREYDIRQISDAAAQLADRLEGLATGYTLSLRRLERMLATCGIEPVACLGEPVDPEWMEVVQVVAADTQPPGRVVDEVRRGYQRHGQVYRFAQVVASRANPPASSESETDEDRASRIADRNE